MVAAVGSNGGQASDYLSDVGGKVPSVPAPSLPLLLVPSCPAGVELNTAGHVVVGSEMTCKFVPHKDTRQVGGCGWCMWWGRGVGWRVGWQMCGDPIPPRELQVVNPGAWC